MQFNSTKIEETFASLNLGLTTFVSNTISNLEQGIAQLQKTVKDYQTENEKLKKQVEELKGPDKPTVVE